MMFTVIFAEKETIKLFEETKMFFGPLYNSEKVAFCEWNKSADDLDTMVPDLYDLIEYQKEWRAIVLYDDGFEKLNPFDFTNYSESYVSGKNISWDYLKNRRKQRIAAYEKAVSNPLVKLTTALCGHLDFKSVISKDEFSLLMTDQMQSYEYMLKKQFEVLNCLEIAVRFDKYQRDSLKKFVAEDDIDSLIASIKNSDVSGIISLIPDTEILSFIRFIGNDPIFFDPEYTECLIENTKKHELLENIADNFSMKDKLPFEVICVSPRTFDFEKVEQDFNRKKKDRILPSCFTKFNLYNDKLKYILVDVFPKDNKQYKFEKIKYLCFLFIMANNDIPQGAINANNVYSAHVDFNVDVLSDICGVYISKLKSTQLLLKDIEIQLVYDSETSLDNETAQSLFESDVEIPVRIELETDESKLYAEYKKIGLSTDCPEEETTYWSRQYRNINKFFVRYLRGPRRAVKTSVTEDLRKNNRIDDDRALLLSENQTEDVKFHIAEVEQKMVETTTTHLFNTKEFNKQIQDADKEINRGIAQRMTKKKTLFIGLTATIAYLIGFLPLIFGNLSTVKSFMLSLSMMCIVLSLLLLVGFVYLLVLRKRLVNRFKHFNFVMSGICGQINRAIVQFSQYISCVCNIMRGFSVLKKRESFVTRTKKILSYHDLQIAKQIKNVNETFSKYVDFNKLSFKECEPYEFDFTILRDYEYEMPSIYSKKKIEYLQPGNEITIPIDYVESITLTREELYD